MGFKATYSALALTLLCLLVSRSALPQTSTIKVQHQNQIQSLQVPALSINGIDYVDFIMLIEQIGGTCTILPTRMRVDLEGTTAWVGLNRDRVNALSIFSLNHNIISNENGIYIALDDCAPFFRKAFRLTVSSSTPTPPAEQINGGINPLDALSEIGLTPPPDSTAQPASPESYSVIRTVLLDPGHGGYEPGVEGAKGITEKDIALSISNKLETLLRNTHQLSIIRTRKQDTNLSPKQRNIISQNTQADLLISIHAGGAFSEETQGIAVFYPAPDTAGRGVFGSLNFPTVDFSDASKEIAAIINQSIIEETHAVSRGIHPIPNALFNASRRPSILVEVGCLTNRQEEALLGDEQYQTKIALGIAKGIEYLLDRAKHNPPVVTLNPPTVTLNNESFQPEVTPL